MAKHEGGFEGRSEPDSWDMDHEHRVLADIFGIRKEKARRAESRQKDFIYKEAKPLKENERELLARTKTYIDEFFEKKFNQLGAYAHGDQGTETKGLQFDGKIGEVSCCSERRALFNFKTEGKPGEKPDLIVTARRDEQQVGNFKRHYTESVGPCGLCRDAISSVNDQARIVQPVGGEVKTVSVSLIYPSRKLLTVESELGVVDNEYRDLLLAISHDFPITPNEKRLINQAERKLESELDSGEDEERILAAGIGFSGEVYINSTPKLNRNPQSLVIDKPVEFQLGCKATENHDQLVALVIVKGKREGSQQQVHKVMLPAGHGREFIRQFHPLTNVVVDFGKDGLGKLPIEVLYPLVYKLRKRKNGN